MRPYRCHECGNTVFFDNSACVRCGAWLAYVPAERELKSFRPPLDPAATEWEALDGSGRRWRPCAHRLRHQACNWMVDHDIEGELCASCRLSAVIPDLSMADHLRRWAAVEQAKRRVVLTLTRWGLRPEPKRDDADDQGLRFLILAPTFDQAVLTGHQRGVVTINLDEADEVHRERTRVDFGEPWRTLLGHLRHEVAHYLHHRCVEGRPEAEARFRASFGDERNDYAAAMQRHHSLGPAPSWPSQFISAYASAHPHEDWAETVAHLLLVDDALETAYRWGLRLDSHAAQAEPNEGLLNRRDASLREVLVQEWLPVAQVLNALNRSIGLPDSYPFQLSDAVLDKMSLARDLLVEAGIGQAPSGLAPTGDLQTMLA